MFADKSALTGRGMKRTVLSALAVAGLLLAGCGPAKPQPTAGPDVQQLAATIAAATIEAEAAQTATARAVPTIALPTPTVKPTLYINAASASCRNGPGHDFQLVASFPAGTSLDLVGRDTTTGYWIVLDPASGASCWIQVQDATPSGSFEGVPLITPQPVTASIPAAPANLSWPFLCTYVAGIKYQAKVNLSWYDMATNESGYRVYRAGTLVADLPANATSYADTADFFVGTPLKYGVAAYNEAGESGQVTTSPPIVCAK